VIHGMSDEQDLRNMGALRKGLPITFVVMVIGTLSLTGFPFTAGYFSKDAIIEVAYASERGTSGYAFAMLVIAAFLTSFYSWRLIFMAFFGKPRYSDEIAHHIHESPWVMLLPLILLAAGALIAGYAAKDFFIGEGYGAFWRAALFNRPDNHILEEAHHGAEWVAMLPTLMMAAGFAVAWLAYIAYPETPQITIRMFKPIHAFLYHKWYFDELYDLIFVRPFKWLARVLWKVGDGLIIDGLGPDGVSARVLDITNRVVRLQTGFVYHYAFVMLIGIALMISYFAWVYWAQLGRGF
jgi:NADH-quinone oxidoreductase subunit L